MTEIISPIATSLIALFLAVFGWRIIIRISKRRESYDICSSLIGLLERMETDVTNAWSPSTSFLDPYTEKRLSNLITGIELRLDILHSHYHSTRITSEQMQLMKQLTTLPEALLSGADRGFGLHVLVTELITILLEDNYEFMNRGWIPIRKSKSTFAPIVKETGGRMKMDRGQK